MRRHARARKEYQAPSLDPSVFRAYSLAWNHEIGRRFISRLSIYFPMFLRTFLTGLSSIAIALLGASCGVGSRSQAPHRAPRALYQWRDDGGEGRVSIRISLSDQIAEFKRGERDIGWCYVATGKEGHDTVPGNYRIMEKIEDKHSNLYGWFEDEFGNVTDNDAQASERVPAGMVYIAAPMPYWMRLTAGGVGMHGGLIPEPGKPASHGCIRLPKEFVPELFEVVKVGTPVTITHAPRQSEHLQSASHPPVESWDSRRDQGDGSVQSVTYHNGVPVFYE
jgi:hypothetical protein